MTRPRRSLWLLAAVTWALGACSGDSSTSGAGGSSTAGGAGGTGGAGGSSETGGSGGATSGGTAGTGGGAGIGGSGGTGGAGTGGASGTGGTGGTAGSPGGDASNDGPPTIDGGRCLAPGTHTVVNVESDGYVISGSTVNAAITLCRGYTYTFAVNAPFHPFFIRRDVGGQYDTGITNNRTANGNLVFAVPMDAPAMLFYECTAHSWMTGPIFIVN